MGRIFSEIEYQPAAACFKCAFGDAQGHGSTRAKVISDVARCAAARPEVCMSTGGKSSLFPELPRFLTGAVHGPRTKAEAKKGPIVGRFCRALP